MTKSTWKEAPENGSWNDSTNWDPSGVPVTTAAFSASEITQIVFSSASSETVQAVEFDEGAPPYKFTFSSGDSSPALNIAGAGVVNNSPSLQHFCVASVSTGTDDPQLTFSGTASAGGKNMHYEAGPVSAADAGGGVISFTASSNAGSANFVAWTGAKPPPKTDKFTVGGEVNFLNSASAANATFTTYGTLGTDGDTFGNIVFWDDATAANAAFTSKGGTLPHGDGGNTQFYGNTTAANGTFHNCGAVIEKGNGGDVAFDATATGGNGYFHNYPGAVTGAYGGVTSFNNNPSTWPPPDPPLLKITEGATAGSGKYMNYSASETGQGLGGHTEFTAKYGSPNAGNGTFVNWGAGVAANNSSQTGCTTLTVTVAQDKPIPPENYYPSAGSGTFWNLPGTVPGAYGGYTQFDVYAPYGTQWAGHYPRNPPTADNATIICEGANVANAYGGSASFQRNATAAQARLIARAGSNGGHGGQLEFTDISSGGEATVSLYGDGTITGNGTLVLSGHSGQLTIGQLIVSGGTIKVQLGESVTSLVVSQSVSIETLGPFFDFSGTVAAGTPYRILSAPNLAGFSAHLFNGSNIGILEPVFEVKGNDLWVKFN